MITRMRFAFTTVDNLRVTSETTRNLDAKRNVLDAIESCQPFAFVPQKDALVGFVAGARLALVTA